MIEPFIITGEIDARVTNNFLSLAAAKIITDVVICSPGGDIGAMFGMFDVIRMQGINTHVVGMAQSAAAVLSQAGHKRTMTNASLLLFHGPEENVSDRDFRLYTQMAEMVSQATGLAIPEAHGLFDGMFINANKAQQLGLIDEIATENPVDPKDSSELRWTQDVRRTSR